MSSGILPASLGTLEARNSDGTGNNIANQNWGAEGVYVRVTPNSYADDLGQMATGPDPRAISDAVLAQPQVNDVDIDLPNAAETNEFFQFFGQFVTHDITEAAAGNPGDLAEVIDPIDGLPFPFVRSGFTIDGNLVRQQFTIETSFLDLSMVYGANTAMLDFLRADLPGGGQSAKMLTSASNVLPSFQDVANDAGVQPTDVLAINGGVNALGQFSPNLLVSGDDRTNQSAALITQHTIWVREHNYQVDRLAQQFPTWTQEQLFQAARAITEAEWQNVVYSEYLPKLVGENAIDDYAGYKANINPAVINEWATIAFRFGHDQSSNSFDTLAENGAASGTFTLAAAFNLANASNAIRNGGSLDEWVRGQLSHQTQEIDGKIVDGNRNLLFGGAVTDLNVLDIQRGRDHGVGDYNTLRAGLQLAEYASFEAFAAGNNLDSATLDALIGVYGSIDNLDSLVGGLLEKHAVGSQVGTTFTRLIVAQFENLRDGDRFYFENRFAADTGFINDTKATSLSDIIARNTGIQYMYHDAFAAHERVGGTDGAETLNGFAKKDLIIGFAGDDVANGADGDDDIYGGQGNDTLRGQAGNDRLAGEGGNDTIDGGAGNDTALYTKSAAVTIDLQTGSGSGGDATGDTLISIENLIGGAGDDILRGDGFGNEFKGGSGNDTLEGRAGGDRLDGGAGSDTASYAGSVGVVIDLQTGAASGGDATGDILVSIENLIGSSGADTLSGNSGSNRLSGGGGNDVLHGGAGNDALDGGDGSDTLNGDDGHDYLDGGAGADAMRGGAGDDTYIVDDSSDNVLDSNGYDTIYTSASFTLPADSGVETLIGTGGNALNLVGNALANIILGAAGNDTLDGQDGNDHLDGGVGADVMRGGAGDDVYFVDDAFDIVFDSSGYDTVYASVNYTLAADSGIDALIITGGNGVNLSGNAFANILMGGSGPDRLDGLGGNDRLYGNVGNDKLYGGRGIDYLFGDSGNDRLYGGAENDRMSGGAGSDTFVFNTRPNKKTNLDRIADYSVKYDSIALDDAVFKKIGKGSETKPGKLSKNYFTLGDHAKDSNDHVFYNGKTGILYYDSDGTGGAKAVEIAVLKKHLKMTYKDFFII